MKKARETRLSQLDVQRKSAWLIPADKTLAVFPCHMLSRALKKFVKILSLFLIVVQSSGGKSQSTPKIATA